MNPERIITQDELDHYALQAAGFQDAMEAQGIPIEDPLNLPAMLLGAFNGNRSLTTQVINRSVELRLNPDLRQDVKQRLYSADER